MALIVGSTIAWLATKASLTKQMEGIKATEQARYAELEKQFVSLKATSQAELKAAAQFAQRLNEEMALQQKIVGQRQAEHTALNNLLATATANHQAATDALVIKAQEMEQLKREMAAIREERDTNNRLLATAQADNNAMEEKLQSQLQQMVELNKKFTTEFENIANKILDTKTQKFTDLNKENLKGILEPLGKNIDEFKRQVDDVYNTEAKERFSLGNEVKKLAELNRLLGDEARNLTRALKGEAKTQGRWGEVILENILSKSGLRKGEEYFMEYQLFDAEGKPLRSEAEGKKMRPDALVMYPDNRHVIIDAKVSLNAFIRFMETDNAASQKAEMEAHVLAIKTHINELSKRAYDDYNKTLDFVMMFMPNEPAYITAMQGEPDLWNYAYERRILLISPTNLIAALKLMVDLWKRENNNRNAQAIAERGAKMYDKFVGFVENLESVGIHLDKAQGKYAEAYKQLSTGNDNLVSQAGKLKALRLKTRKELSEGLAELGLQNDTEVIAD